MKSKNVLLIALMAVCVSVLASENEPVASKVVVFSQKPGIFKVIYEGPKAGKVSMWIADKNGNVVFEEVINNLNGFIRPVNFIGMESGIYTIGISDENGKQVQTVNYQVETPVENVRISTVKNVHIARIAGEGKYLLTVTNEGTGEINVRIFDGANNLVHDQNMTISGDFGLIYNLKQVDGTPTFEVTEDRK